MPLDPRAPVRAARPPWAVALLGALLLVATPAVAGKRDPDAPRPVKAVVYTQVTVEQLEDLLRSRSIQFQTIRADGVDSFVRARVGTYQIIVGLHDGGTGPATDLVLYAGFQASAPPTLEQINAWNASQRWGRAYLDAAGDPVLESDIDLSGGVLPAHVLDRIEHFGATVDGFAEAIGFR